MYFYIKIGSWNRNSVLLVFYIKVASWREQEQCTFTLRLVAGGNRNSVLFTYMLDLITITVFSPKPGKDY